MTAQASSSAEAAKASFEKLCTACQRTYYSENAYQNHLGSQKHRLRISALQNGGGAAKDDETGSVISSTISLGEPVSLAPKETIDPEAEAEFSKVVNGIMETKIDDSEPVSARPSRPHHSAAEDRLEHPLSQPAASDSNKPEQISTEIPINRCLFCNYDSPSLKLSVMHMTKFHGLFIPEQPYLVDLEGLVGYLYQKINMLHECLYCHKIKASTSGIQTHMRDKGHCMIAFESEEEMIEVGQFYDFRSSYSDAEDDDDDDDGRDNDEMVDVKGGVKLGSRGPKPLKTVITNSNGDQEMDVDEGDENAEGWETDSSASSLDSADLTAVPIDHSHAFQRLPMHRHHSLTDPRPHRTVDGFHSHAHNHHAVFRSEYELHLPSGRTAGHRSLSRYYRQNLHSYPTPAERMETQRMLENAAHSSDDDKMAIDSPNNDRGRALTTRANGGMGMIGVSDAKKREIQAVEKRERKREHRARKQFEWGVNKQSNSQKHFRDPLLQ